MHTHELCYYKFWGRGAISIADVEDKNTYKNYFLCNGYWFRLISSSRAKFEDNGGHIILRTYGILDHLNVVDRNGGVQFLGLCY